MAKETTLQTRQQIVELKESGLTLSRIAEQFGLSLSCVRKFWRRFRDLGKQGLERLPGVLKMRRHIRRQKVCAKRSLKPNGNIRVGAGNSLRGSLTVADSRPFRIGVRSNASYILKFRGTIYHRLTIAFNFKLKDPGLVLGLLWWEDGDRKCEKIADRKNTDRMRRDNMHSEMFLGSSAMIG